jgi:hypothetical protein
VKAGLSKNSLISVAKAMAGRPAKVRRLSAETLVKAGLSKNSLISVAKAIAGRPAKVRRLSAEVLT